METVAVAASSGGGVTGEGSSKVRGRGEGEAWGSGGIRSPGGPELPGNQTPSPRARRMAGDEGVTSGSTRGVLRESDARSEACSFREPPPAEGSDCTFPIFDGGRRLRLNKLAAVRRRALRGLHGSGCSGTAPACIGLPGPSVSPRPPVPYLSLRLSGSSWPRPLPQARRAAVLTLGAQLLNVLRGLLTLTPRLLRSHP